MRLPRISHLNAVAVPLLVLALGVWGGVVAAAAEPEPPEEPAEEAEGREEEREEPEEPEEPAEEPADDAAEADAELLTRETFTVRIGRVTVELPILAGFRPVRREKPAVLDRVGTPVGQEALDALLTVEILESGRGLPVRMHIVLTKTASKRVRIDAEEFLDLRTDIRKEIVAELEAAAAKGAKGEEREVGVGQTQIVEIFDETEDSISLLAVSRVRRGRREILTVYQALTTCRLNERVLYLTTSSKAGDEDREWVKRVNRAWVRRAIELNAPAPSRDGGGGSESD